MASQARFVWLDFGWWPQPDNGPKKLLSWNAETHELSFWPLDREPPIVLAVIETEDEVRARLDGWADYNTAEEGLEWLAARLDGYR